MSSLIRMFAFVRKEVVDAARQPMLLLSLIVGPFLILLVFGAGLRESDPPLRAALVVTEDSTIRDEVDEFAEEQQDSERLIIDSVTTQRSLTMADLRSGHLDLVIVFPDEVAEAVEDGEQSTITVFHNQVDPIEGRAIALFSRTAVDQINNRLLEGVVADLQERAREVWAADADVVAAGDAASEEEVDGELDGDVDDAVDTYLELDPAVLVSPFRGEAETLAGRTIQMTGFYAPAVVVVLLQHLAVTLLGLSVVRERALGATQLFQVSPLRTGEYLGGKLLAYLVLGSIVGAVLVAGMVGLLGTPMAGHWWELAVGLVVLLFAATALGLVLSLVAQNDSQAVQYAMLVLLATIFLSGFLISLDRFLPFARPLAWLLPSTYAIRIVRDVMLRGSPLDPLVLGGLVAYGLVFAVVGAWLASRRLTRAGVAG